MMKALFRKMIFLAVAVLISSPSWGAETPPPNAAPSPMPMMPAAKPVAVPEGIQVDRDVVFASPDGHDLKLDIAYPKAPQGKLPAIVNIHGGGYAMGDKNANESITYAKYGFVGVSIQYRLSGVAKFPAAVQDCKTAIRWVRANAEKYGIDPDRIGVMGESAGGHLVSLLGTSGGDAYLEGDGPYGKYSSKVHAVVDNFGPIDFMPLKEAPSPMEVGETRGPVTRWLGKSAQEAPELAKKANPITYIDPSDPPVLMIHGEKDALVPIAQSELFYDALTQARIKAKLVRVKNAGHGFEADPKDAVISPSAEEIVNIQMGWFKEVFGVK